MQKIALQYGTAAHLALLTVAPLFLFSAVPGTAVQAIILGWLALLSALWVVMNPSVRWGELPRDARRRIGFEIGRDPVLFVAVCGVVLSAVRAANGGISLGYDASSRLWSLTGPLLSVLPGSVTGAGLLPLAGVLALSVVTLGVRHSLGRRQRFAYLLLTSVLAALVVGFWFFRRSKGLPPSVFNRTLSDPFWPGSSLTIYMAFAAVAWTLCWKSRTALFETILMLSVAALLSGVLFCAPPLAVLVSVSVVLGILVWGAIPYLFSRSITLWLRTALLLMIAMTPMAFLLVGGSCPWPWPVIADGFSELEEVTSRIALASWKGSVWAGSGIGTYPLQLGFFASASDWQILSPGQTAGPNGLLHFLFERGILGSALVVVGIGFLLRDAVLRFIRARRGWTVGPLHALGLIALLTVVALSFFEATFAQVEFLLPIGAALALTVAAIPDAQEDVEEEEDDHG